MKEIVAGFVLLLAVGAGFSAVARHIAAAGSAQPAATPPIAGPMRFKTFDSDFSFDGVEKKGPGILVPAGGPTGR